MRFEGNYTCLNVHTSTRRRVQEIKESMGFNSAEELINYLIDRYIEEGNEKEDTSNEDGDIE